MVNSKADEKKWDCVIIGGGISGLVAANFLRRSGKTVLIIEKSKKVGGRAITKEVKGGFLNLGPHALYEDGHSMQILKELGISLEGGSPDIDGILLSKNVLCPLPTSPFSLLTSKLIDWKGKMELIQFYLKLERGKEEPLKHVSFKDWLDEHIHSEKAKQFLLTLMRLSTYCSNPDDLSAEVVFKRLRMKKTIYLKNGWQTMVDALREEAVKMGVAIVSGCSAQSITGTFPKMQVKTNDNRILLARNVLSTLDPSSLSRLVQEHEHSGSLHFLTEMRPVYSASLDVILDSIPKPSVSFALSLDSGFYFSNHSKVTKLSRNDKHEVIHVLKYVNSDEQLSKEEQEAQLLSFMGLIQPGWEKSVVYKRYLHNMVVTHVNSKGGVSTRPDPEVLQLPGLYIAGDWVGDEGWLVDASFKSAEKAAARIVEREGDLING
ncbi:FAD-dependent oxidoreductase [Cytobacillus suaedae]|nr:FAD-dependent oxidoreductase [Cytobacillus suaedae]